MLEILLIRHGQTDWNRDRRIMGGLPIPLNKAGRRQTLELQKALSGLNLKWIYTSPLLRAHQTAKIIAGEGKRIRLIRSPAVSEIDYGRWVGKTFDEVTGDKNYQIYHTTPRLAQAPGGEKMTDVYRRAVGFIETLRKRHKRGRIAVVSHADVIKAILTRYLRLPLDDLLKIRIDNCSLSSLWFNGKHSRVLGINCHARLRRFFLRTDQLPR